MCAGVIWSGRPVANTTSTKPPELHFGHDESERGPAARLDRSLEPLARFRPVAPHEVPIAKAVSERSDLHFVGIRGCDYGVRTNLATIELQAPCVSVGHRLRIRPS